MKNIEQRYGFLLYEELVHVQYTDNDWSFVPVPTYDRMLSGKDVRDTIPSWAWTTDNPMHLIYKYHHRDVNESVGTIDVPKGNYCNRAQPVVITHCTEHDGTLHKRYRRAKMPMLLPPSAITPKELPYLGAINMASKVSGRTIYTTHGSNLQVGSTYYSRSEISKHRRCSILDGDEAVYKCIWEMDYEGYVANLLLELTLGEVAMELSSKQ